MGKEWYEAGAGTRRAGSSDRIHVALRNICSRVQAGLRTRKWEDPAEPPSRTSRHSGEWIRLTLLTVAGTVPEWSFLMTSPASRFTHAARPREHLNAQRSVNEGLKTVNVAGAAVLLQLLEVRDDVRPGLRIVDLEIHLGAGNQRTRVRQPAIQQVLIPDQTGVLERR